MGGTGHEIEFRTDGYAKQGIILVTINYRVGVFGFFAREWLNDDKQSIGNFGILDQIVALNWISENISANLSYVYYFKRDLPGDDAQAFHSAELWYMFGTLDRCWRPMEKEDFDLSTEMLSYWSNFIKNGNPNGEGLEEWKKYTE